MSDHHDKALTHVPSQPVPERMSPIVSAGMAILQANPDPATLRELLAVQREWEAGEARRMFNVALHALKKDLPRAIVKRHEVKDRNKVLMYRHATLADIMAAVTDPLELHGFTVTWSPSCGGGLVSVRCQLHHVGGHSVETTMAAPADAGQNRNAVQAIGSTQTYLQRYTLCALLGLAAVDADDADQHPAEPKPPPVDEVDQRKNQQALAWLLRHGWTEERCIDALEGAPREQWTRANLSTLRAAYESQSAPTEDLPEVDPNTGEVVPPAPPREPGDDDE